MALTPGQLLGDKYRLSHALGEGGMGAVWAADDVHLGRSVAIKVLGPGVDEAVAHRRFLREARLAAQLRGPHVAQVFDVGLHEGQAFIVMEHLEGEDLERRLARGRLAPSAVATWMDGACAALAEAHQRGIVHRDIKPANLFFARAGGRETLKVLDFGIAMRREGSGRLTTEGTIIGTPLYMSPEQSQGLEVDHRSDLWSLAVVAYESLTGTQPFLGKTDWEALAAIAKRPVPDPSTLVPTLPSSLDELFRHALRREPAQRFQSAELFGRAFAAAARGEYPPPDVTADTTPMAIGPASTARRAITDVVAIDEGRPTRALPLRPLALVAGLGAVAALAYVAAPLGDERALLVSTRLVDNIELEREPRSAPPPAGPSASSAAPVAPSMVAPDPSRAPAPRAREATAPKLEAPRAAPSPAAPSPAAPSAAAPSTTAPSTTAPSPPPRPKNEFGI